MHEDTPVLDTAPPGDSKANIYVYIKKEMEREIGGVEVRKR